MRRPSAMFVGLCLTMGACAGELGSRDAAASGIDVGGARDAPEPDAVDDAPRAGDARGDGATADARGDAAVDAGPRAATITVELVTDQHRFVPGAMFGGWGPHLGHLVREGGALYWVDDVCDQAAPGDCDVNVNRRVGVFRRDAGGWARIATIPLDGVQQNTGTLAAAGTLRSYGVDVTASRVVECTYAIASGSSTCAPIPIPLGLSANYVGAALSRAGSRVAWWTNVVDGGGGSFSYVVDYGGGWNGPRAGGVGGYNDCAYVNAAFDPTTPAVTFFGQVVSGLGPAWAFSTLVGEASLATTDAPTWSNALAPPAGDTIASTNDLYVDDVTGDAHLLARATSGAVVYYARPSGGAWSGPMVVEASSYRARWLATATTIAIVTGPNAGDLTARIFTRAALAAGTPLPISAAIAHPLAVPAGFGPVLAIYPEADVYQADDVAALDFVVVGSTRENEAWHVTLAL